MRNTLRPVWWFVYIRGDRVTWKVLAEYSWSPTTIQSGSFLRTAASSTPNRIVTREVRYIPELSLTLEHSMPISSPATPGLTPSHLEGAATTSVVKLDR